jgi:hypothetical protein
MGLSFANIDLGSALSGAGQLFKDIRTALTGKEPIDSTKAAELAIKVQEMETTIETTRLSVMVAEASSQDKWTSRARPMFLYVVYIFILAAFPMGLVFAFRPMEAAAIVSGVHAWLAAIPESMWVLFGSGYLGYVGARTYDKAKTGCK